MVFGGFRNGIWHSNWIQATESRAVLTESAPKENLRGPQVVSVLAECGGIHG
jgi:hypothetical protein